MLLCFVVSATAFAADIDTVPGKWRTPFDLYLMYFNFDAAD